MTQNNFRKDPFFGDPLNNLEENGITDSSKTSDIHNAPYVSLHSNQAPGHTFTPMMERSGAASEVQSSEVVKPVKEFPFTPSLDNSQTETKETENSNSSLKVDAINTSDNIELDEGISTQESGVKSSAEGFTTERIIPSAAAVAATATALGAKEAVKAKIPPKTRRLLLVALLALVLLVVFFLLKPNTPETVEELQSQQGSSLPIEFRPVDEAEAKRAEEQARADQEAALKAQEQQIQDKQPEKVQENLNTQPVTQSGQTTNPLQASTEAPVLAKPVENKPAIQTTIKPQTQGSVVYQPEVVAKPQPKTVRVQQQVKDNVKVIQEKATVKRETQTAKVSASTVATSTKTMTVPKGVSLMQVFRDNNLNISDVNAMSKVNNVVSNLKVGERITVRLDKNNRVIEMSIGSGGQFTRQANGSYTFK